MSEHNGKLLPPLYQKSIDFDLVISGPKLGVS